MIASDLGAFRRVLDEGTLGLLTRTGDAAALASAISSVLDDPATARARADAASVAVRRYDWSRVAAQILDVYETVTIGADRVGEDPRLGLLARWRPKVS